MAEGLVKEASDSLLLQQGGVNVFAHLSEAIGSYLEVPPIARELPGWRDLDLPGRELFAQRFDEWASLFAAADVAVRAAVSLELSSALALEHALDMYEEIGPLYGMERTWTLGAYAQTSALAAGPVRRVELLRIQTEPVLEDDAASLVPFWRWHRGRLHKQWFYEKRKPVIRSGAALTDQWWDWHRQAGVFKDEDPTDSPPTLYEQGMAALAEVQEVLTGKQVARGRVAPDAS